MEKFEIKSYWSDENTFPDPLDTGKIIECKNIEDATQEALKSVKPQVKPYLEIDESHEDLTIITYMPSPSKNKTGYQETIEITKI